MFNMYRKLGWEAQETQETPMGWSSCPDTSVTYSGGKKEAEDEIFCKEMTEWANDEDLL